jgi:hypothetical protein
LRSNSRACSKATACSTTRSKATTCTTTRSKQASCFRRCYKATFCPTKNNRTRWWRRRSSIQKDHDLGLLQQWLCWRAWRRRIFKQLNEVVSWYIFVVMDQK